VDATLTRNTSYNLEYRIIRPDGEERIVCEIGEATFDESGKPLRFTGTVQDITERKCAADALENAAKRERAMIENALDVICTVNAKGEFVSVSPACLKVWGYSSDELIGRRYIELVTPEDVAKTNEIAVSIMSGYETINFENRYRHKNGSLVPIRWSAYWSEQEQLMFSVAHDITEQRRAETALRQSESRMRALLDAIPDLMFRCDKAGVILDFSATHQEDLILPLSEFIGKNMRDVLPPPVVQQTMRHITLAIETGTMQIFEYPLEVNKIEKSYEARIVAASDSEVTAIVRDVTERKRDEANLTRLALVARKTQNAVIVTDAEGYIQWVNEGFTRLTGYEFDEVVGNLGYLLQGDETNAETVETIRTTMWARQPFSEEIYNYKKDGTGFWMSISITPTFDDDGEVQGFVAVQMDITERKQAEVKLRASEANLAAAQRITHLGSWEVELSDLRRINKNKVHWSDEVYRIFGYQPGAIQVSISRYFDSIHPDDRKYCRRAFIEAVLDRKDLIIEFRVVLPNGSEKILHGQAEVIYDEQSRQPLKFIGTVQDITKWKQADEKIWERGEWLRAILDGSRDGIIIEDGSEISYINKSYAQLLGYDSPKQLADKQISDFLPSDEFRRLMEYGERRLRGESAPSVYEFKTIHKDGNLIEVEGAVSTSMIGGKQFIMTAIRDITERKRQAASLALSNDLLKQSEESYRIVAETASDVIITIDEFSTILFANPAAEKVLGYKPEELIGSNLSVLVPERLKATHRAGMSRYLQTGERRIPWGGVEFQALRRDGSEIQIEISFGEYRESNKRLFTAIIRDISERKHAEQALRKAETRYRSLVELSPAVVYLAQPYPPYSPIYVSPNVKMFGYQSAEWLSRDDMWRSIIHKEDRARVLRITENAMSQGLDTELEYRILGRNGEIYWVHDKGSFISDEQGEKIGWQGVILDITKTQALEEQLRQSQKLESVGLLAGGIAHDFNNMLTAINGYSALTLRRLKEDDPLRRNIEEIKKAGARSADLTQQLLAFSRQQVLQPVVLNLNEVITDTIKMLQRLIGEDIQITTVLNPKVGRVKVDPGQFSQIVINLAVNARDAMSQGGKMTIETANIFLSPDYAEQHVAVLPGAYVMLAVSDTGTGMSAETKDHIFEPFFTTKDVGQGTGLGLATVYGIVKQSGGIIEVESGQGSGTTFKIYLPRVAEEVRETNVKNIPVEMPKGTETILLVEDEEMVRNLSREVLEECGYTVIEAVNGIEALELCDKGDCKFNLLMTDVVMPKLGGREMADLLKEKLPDLQVLFTSGYTDDAIVRHGVSELGTNFIQKPFTPDLLAKKIRELLDSSEKGVY